MYFNYIFEDHVHNCFQMGALGGRAAHGAGVGERASPQAHTGLTVAPGTELTTGVWLSLEPAFHLTDGETEAWGNRLRPANFTQQSGTGKVP